MRYTEPEITKYGKQANLYKRTWLVILSTTKNKIICIYKEHFYICIYGNGVFRLNRLKKLMAPAILIDMQYRRPN